MITASRKSHLRPHESVSEPSSALNEPTAGRLVGEQASGLWQGNAWNLLLGVIVYEKIEAWPQKLNGSF